MDWCSLLAVLVFAATALVLSLRQGRDGRRRTLLATALGIAALGAWAALENRAVLATTLLIGGAIAAVVTSLFAPADGRFRQKSESIGGREWALLIGIVVGAGLLRFSGLDRFPDFIHGEENVWTWQVATRLFSPLRSWPIPWYSKGVPVSYVQEWPFFRLFGLNYLAPRYEVAFFGTLTVGLFYLLARTLVEKRIALFSTALLATSAVALAASRAAFVQSHILFWTVAAYLLYVQAVERRKPILFLLAGGTLALGALTYQTFMTAIAVVGLHSAYEALRDVRRWRSQVVNLTLLASPVLLVWPRVAWYLRSQKGHVLSGTGSLTEIAGSPLKVPSTYATAAWDNLRVMLQNVFYRQTWADYLIIRPGGPIFLAGVTALAVIGVALILPRARQRWPSFLLIWFFIQASFSPVVLGMPIVRAILPAYPALFLFAGIGLFAVAPNFQKSNSRLLRYPSVAAVLALTGVLATTGALAYFAETKATFEGQQRQALADVIDQYGGPDTLLLFPYRPATADLFDAERDSIRFMVAGKTGGFDKAAEFYAIIPEDQLLTTLRSNDSGARRAVIVVQDHWAPDQAAEVHVDVADALTFCYPGRPWNQLDLLSARVVEDRFSTACDTNATPVPIAVRSDAPLSTTFQWNASPNSGPFSLEVERKRDGVDYHEMESFAPNNGWASEGKYASGYSGSGYLYDDPNAGTGVFGLQVAMQATYTLWLRTYRRNPDDAHRWISVDGRMLGELAPPEATPLGKWTWQAFGPVDLQTGTHILYLTRQGGGAALFIDALYVSRDEGFDPETDVLWLPALKTRVQQQPAPIQSFTFNESLPPGNYRWRVTSLNAFAVNGLGEPAQSAPMEFTVAP